MQKLPYPNSGNAVRQDRMARLLLRAVESLHFSVSIVRKLSITVPRHRSGLAHLVLVLYVPDLSASSTGCAPLPTLFAALCTVQTVANPADAQGQPITPLSPPQTDFPPNLSSPKVLGDRAYCSDGVRSHRQRPSLAYLQGKTTCLEPVTTRRSDLRRRAIHVTDGQRSCIREPTRM